ncbi:unnamed protein product, partial [Laminaria digitata]
MFRTTFSLLTATLILRTVEGIWRLPFGGGVLEALVGAYHRCCWR